jgi:hypothetical protein
MSGFKLESPPYLESDLQSACLEWLQAKRIFAVRVPLGPVLHRLGHGENVRTFWRKNPLKGFPDCHGILQKKYRGRAFYLEFKSAKGRLTPEQVSWLANLQAAGAACAVIRSLRELERIMREWGELS